MLRTQVANFTFNLGFSGKFYHTGKKGLRVRRQVRGSGMAGWGHRQEAQVTRAATGRGAVSWDEPRPTSPSPRAPARPREEPKGPRAEGTCVVCLSTAWVAQ